MRYTIILAAGLAVILGGCGGDSGSGPDDQPPKVTRLVANSTVAEPTLSSPDEAMWASVAGTTADLIRSGAVAKPTGVPSSVGAKAIVKSGKLYLRVEWVDSDLSLWRDYWTLINNSSFTFTRTVEFDEDQFFAMFVMPVSASYDTWNWRALTTGPAGLAQGYTFTSGTLTADAGNQTPVKANVDPFDPARPLWIHNTKSAFTGPLLYMSEAFEQTSIGDFGPGWLPQQKVPGFVIDLSVVDLLDANPQSRWDITTVSSYDEVTNTHKLVMCRALNTGYEDDLDMSTLDSVQVRLGALDKQDELTTNNSSQQGFSNAFWIVLP